MVPRTDTRSKLEALARGQLQLPASLSERDARLRHLSLGLADP
jgi:hypothetical protein